MLQHCEVPVGPIQGALCNRDKLSGVKHWGQGRSAGKRGDRNQHLNDARPVADDGRVHIRDKLHHGGIC